MGRNDRLWFTSTGQLGKQRRNLMEGAEVDDVSIEQAGLDHRQRIDGAMHGLRGGQLVDQGDDLRVLGK